MNIFKIKIKSMTFAAAAKTAGRLGTALNGVENADDVVETCRRYGKDSSLCHETAAGGSVIFGASEYLGKVAGESVGEWLGCNAALDIETLGTGIVACTLAVGGASIIAGNASGNLLKAGTKDIYGASVIYSKKYALSREQ